MNAAPGLADHLTYEQAAALNQDLLDEADDLRLTKDSLVRQMNQETRPEILIRVCADIVQINQKIADKYDEWVIVDNRLQQLQPPPPPPPAHEEEDEEDEPER